MAVVNGTGEWIGKGTHKMTWATLANGDTGSTYSAHRLNDKTIQVKGTFGAGGSVQIEGSNDGGTTWAILNDTRGETTGAMTFTAADVRTLLENPQMIRPNVTAGDGTTSLTILVVSHGS